MAAAPPSENQHETSASHGSAQLVDELRGSQSTAHQLPQGPGCTPGGPWRTEDKQTDQPKAIFGNHSPTVTLKHTRAPRGCDVVNFITLCPYKLGSAWQQRHRGARYRRLTLNPVGVVNSFPNDSFLAGRVAGIASAAESWGPGLRVPGKPPPSAGIASAVESWGPGPRVPGKPPPSAPLLCCEDCRQQSGYFRGPLRPRLGGARPPRVRECQAEVGQGWG